MNILHMGRCGVGLVCLLDRLIRWPSSVRRCSTHSGLLSWLGRQVVLWLSAIIYWQVLSGLMTSRSGQGCCLLKILHVGSGGVGLVCLLGRLVRRQNWSGLMAGWDGQGCFLLNRLRVGSVGDLVRWLDRQVVVHLGIILLCRRRSGLSARWSWLVLPVH